MNWEGLSSLLGVVGWWSCGGSHEYEVIAQTTAFETSISNSRVAPCPLLAIYLADFLSNFSMLYQNG